MAFMLTAAFVSSLFAVTEKPKKIVPCPASDFIIIVQCISKGVWGFFFSTGKNPPCGVRWGQPTCTACAKAAKLAT